MNAQILTLSSKGQISLPIAIRRNLNIDTGDKLAVYTSGDVVMLKVLRLPTLEEISETLDEAKEWAETVGYKESDVNDIIKSVRRKKRK
ncbi:MAG: AbrB/MazE/SpoVT family DNA-binding domain-containing protein [Candidatus Riflebacteria bacterium]|jgi:antitoxin PrlF|nr:AbrB/MazE/SpoVT family DNA-binding domain-containing protein [Candidatus Riflebacteria bacterium]